MTSATVAAAELEGVDAVVHLAALSNDPLGALDPSLTYRINRDATVTLAFVAKEAGVGRFVFASSCSAYGAAGSGEPLDEQAAPAADRLCRVEGALGGGTALLRGLVLLARLHAERDGVRGVAPAARRPRPQ